MIKVIAFCWCSHNLQTKPHEQRKEVLDIVVLHLETVTKIGGTKHVKCRPGMGQKLCAAT